MSPSSKSNSAIRATLPLRKAGSKTCWFVALLLVASLLAPLAGQRAAAGPDEQLYLIGQSFLDSVRLRWAPGNPEIWAAVREVGLHVDRYTLMREGSLVGEAERQQAKRLTATPIFPQPEAVFGAAAANDRYIAIGGQSIYGKTFEVGSSPGDEADYGGILDLAREQSNRFGFGLFAADQSWPAAAMMGLAFTDLVPHRNEVYLYRLVPAQSISTYDPLKAGFTTVTVNDNAPPPPVQRVATEFRDRQAVLSWELGLASGFYSAYYILRSTDDNTYERVNRDGQPFVPLTEPGLDQKAYFQDSLGRNNQVYFYKVVGQTPFGTLGPPSAAVQGMGLDPKPAAGPSISGIFPQESGGLSVNWSFPEGESINAFEVQRARKIGGPYTAVSGRLAAGERAFVDETPLSVNYYRVVVFDQYERILQSYPALAQPEDERAPEIPRGLSGLILQDGRIVLNWDENTEEDLLGYRIWFSNQRDAEYSLATGAPIAHNYYLGNTSLNTLSRKLYAKIVALDLRHNTSPLSDPIELIRPDTIPPAAPLMKEVRATYDSLTVKWAFSRSIDVAAQRLERRAVADADSSWTVITTYTPAQTGSQGSYRDVGLRKGEVFAYRLVAVDYTGLTSPSNTVEGAILDDFIRAPVTGVRATADRRAKSIELTWQYPAAPANLQGFEIWRSEAGHNPTSVGRLPLPSAPASSQRVTFRYTDAHTLRINTRYAYTIKAIFSDGAESSFSAPYTVQF